MRNIIVVEYMSIDGVIQAPGRPEEDRDEGFEHGGWTGPWMRDHRRYTLEAFRATDAILFGRRTYEIFAEYWPTVKNDRDEMAHTLNSRPKYVVSTTLKQAHWPGTTVIARNVVQEVGKLKEQGGKGILVVGSSELAQTLMQHDLVDEYQLWVHPVVLGGGKRLFHDGDPKTVLRLVNSTTTGTGMVILAYAPAR